ncbi:MAG: homocysteine S-methyltransferase family protein [Methylobacteriaceae bacterium]|jgi:S-methylmethionine-dependent homocysteine/selenocysteine methylase|nr:homocysteine S-methyltransferase family protein [Methylobacteriaceae bacterium]
MTRHTLILDGGMSRELMRVGAPFRQPEWSALALMESPSLVRQVHEEFILAGADIVTTNSYAVVPFHIGEQRFRSDGLRLAALAGSLAREAADAFPEKKVQVAGSLPPVCGSYRPEAFDPVVARGILEVLVQGMAPSIDFWLAETQSSLAEVRLVHEVLSGSSKPLWVSFTLADDTIPYSPEDSRLRSGESVADAAAFVAGIDARALLFNCSMPEVMDAAIKSAKTVLRSLDKGIPVGVYANAFSSHDNSGAANSGLSAVRNDLDPDAYGRWACRWVESGAEIVGGCCGIGAAHIHSLAHKYLRG